MKKLYLFLLLAALTNCLAETTKPSSAEDRALERLKKLEQDIRARAAEADAEVQKTQNEADAITKAAEIRAKRIRDEANEYARKIQIEIQEIEKGQKKVFGAPDRELFQATLQSLVDPLLNCWAKTNRKDLEECLLTKVQTGLSSHVQVRYPSSPALCKLRCE